MTWFGIHIDTAPEGITVRTIIKDHHGARNDQALMRIGRLWFCPDGKMYVYYTPTHWMAIDKEAVQCL